MKKINSRKKTLYALGFMAIVFTLTACASQEPIVVGESSPGGLFDLLLVYPISWLIDKMNALTGNGGLAIATATIIINIIVSPLEIYSQVETKKTQEIQPLLTKLQEKYPDSKTDKVQQQKMMIEQQRIYDQHGMSMMGMCLPLIMMMIIQMPLLTAMFAAVRRLTVLNQSSFTLFGINYVFGQPDPGLPFVPVIGPYLKVFIIAAILALFASSYFQMPKDQRGFKNQQAMQMYMMNVMFIFILWKQPIALAIYWIVSNLTRLAMRYLVTNRIVAKQHEKFKTEQRNKRMSKR